MKGDKMKKKYGYPLGYKRKMRQYACDDCAGLKDNEHDCQKCEYLKQEQQQGRKLPAAPAYRKLRKGDKVDGAMASDRPRQAPKPKVKTERKHKGDFAP